MFDDDLDPGTPCVACPVGRYSDVTADALIVERSVYEKQSELGLLRTEGYIIRSVGGIVGAILGAILYNKGSWGWGLSIGQCCRWTF